MLYSQKSALEMIYLALGTLNAERNPLAQIPLQPETVLFGADSVLDSLALVSVISDVEMMVSDALGEPVCLTDDRALGRKNSPFRDVQSLCAYVLEITESAV